MRECRVGLRLPAPAVLWEVRLGRGEAESMAGAPPGAADAAVRIRRAMGRAALTALDFTSQPEAGA